MAHFAHVVTGKVQRVIVAEQDFIDYLSSQPTHVGQYIQTSYNTKNNVHYGPDGNPDGGTALRGNYAAVGYTYDSENDVFYPPKPWDSWTLDTSIWNWAPPVPRPETSGSWAWNEETQTWDAVE